MREVADPWPARVTRLVMRVPGESWSAVVAFPQNVSRLSGAAAGAVRDVADGERWSRLAMVPVDAARQVSSAVAQSGIAGPAERVSRFAGDTSAAVAESFWRLAEGARVPGAGQESVSRFATMVGTLLPTSIAMPGMKRLESGVALQAGSDSKPLAVALPQARQLDGLQPGGVFKAASSRATVPPARATGSGIQYFVRVASRWRRGWEEEEEQTEDGNGSVESDCKPSERASEEYDLKALVRAAEEQDTRQVQPGCGLPQFVPYSSKVPWHEGPRAFFCWFFPKYGNYCGPNWSSGRGQGSLTWDKPPIDHLDYCCYCHDMGYDSHDQRDLLKADLQLLRCLETMPERDRWVRGSSDASFFHKLSIAGTYRVLCIVGLRRFLIPYRKELIKRIEVQERRELYGLKRNKLQDDKSP